MLTSVRAAPEDGEKVLSGRYEMLDRAMASTEAGCWAGEPRLASSAPRSAPRHSSVAGAGRQHPGTSPHLQSR